MIELIHNHADQHQNEVVLSFDQSLLSSFSLFLLPISFQLNFEALVPRVRFSKKYLPIVTVQNMYRSLVEPYFRYSCPAWGVAGINAINRLQKLPSRAARIVTNSAYNASALPIIRKLGWPTINELIESETVRNLEDGVQIAQIG